MYIAVYIGILITPYSPDSMQLKLDEIQDGIVCLHTCNSNEYYIIHRDILD